MDVLSFWAIFTKFALYAGILFSAGSVFYQLLFESETVAGRIPARRLTVIFTCIGMVATLMSYAIRAAALTGNASAMVDPEMLGILWQTPVGTALFLRILGLSLILVGLFTGRLIQSVAAIGCLIALGSFTQIGHVADASDFLLQVLLLIHLLGISIWVGILFPLYQLSSNPSQIVIIGEIAHRFGRLMVLFVPILLIAGGWLAYQLVSSFENLFTTGYGQTLLVKVAIVIGLLGLAAANKLRFVPALRAGDSGALKHLKYSVLLEILLVVFILSTTAVLTSVLTLPEVHS